VRPAPKPAAHTIDLGDGETFEIRPRCTVYEMRTFLSAYRDAVNDCAETARAIEAASDPDALATAIAAEVAATGRIEAVCGHAILLTWVGDGDDDGLKARVAWHGKGYSVEADPLQASGLAAVREMIEAGWDPMLILRIGRECADYLISRLRDAAPEPSEVARQVEVFPQAGEPTTS
jgi:hypothetical protein